MTKREEIAKKWAKLIAKVWMDEKFKAQLMAHPHKVLQEYGFDFSPHETYKIMEDTAKVRHLVIPAKPEGDLSETELRNVVGQTAVCGCAGCDCIMPCTVVR